MRPQVIIAVWGDQPIDTFPAGSRLANYEISKINFILRTSASLQRDVKASLRMDLSTCSPQCYY